jgi:hypothetical protein
MRRASGTGNAARSGTNSVRQASDPHIGSAVSQRRGTSAVQQVLSQPALSCCREGTFFDWHD